MTEPVLRIVRKVIASANSRWFLPLGAALAAADMFVLVIPTDVILVAGAIARPKGWIRTAVWFTTGSAVGALLMAVLLHRFGSSVIHWGEHAHRWDKMAGYVREHGALAIGLIALGPFPLQPGVVVATLAGVPAELIFVAAWAGRLPKYLLFAYLAQRSPEFFKKRRPLLDRAKDQQ